MNRVPLRFVAALNRQVLPETTDPDLKFRYVDISAVDSTGRVALPDELMTFAGAPSRARRVAPAGATAISTVRTYLRSIASVPDSPVPLVLSTGFAVAEATGGYDPRFLYYACRSDPFVDEVVARSVGVSYPAISPGDLAAIPIPSPTIEAQRRIADFLDDQVARIDNIIAARRRQADLVWFSAYSRMIDLVLGRTSDRVPLRRMIDSERLGTWGSEPTGDDLDVACARVADFDRPVFRLGPVRTMRRVDDLSLAARRVIPGDILLERSGGTNRNPVGCAVLVESAPSRMVCSNFVSRVRALEGVDSRYLAAVLAALFASGQQRPHSTQTTGIQNLDTDSYFSLTVPRGSLAEQESTGLRITEGLNEARDADSLLGQSQHLLEELKRSLITAAVTGEFDVSSADGSEALR